jgi:soluble lytic murein transglycosylase-like protein
LKPHQSLISGVVAGLLLAGAAHAESALPNPAHEEPAPTIEALVVRHAHDNGIPVGLAKAVIGIESRGNPHARNHGAMGLMQITTGTARNHGFGGSAAGLLSPDTNLRYGMKVLGDAYRASGGDVCRTLAFYQSGHRVRRFSAAQRSYCSKARAIMARA